MSRGIPASAILPSSGGAWWHPVPMATCSRCGSRIGAGSIQASTGKCQCGGPLVVALAPDVTVTASLEGER